MAHHWPKELLTYVFGTAQFALWASGAVNYDYNVTSSMLAQDLFTMAHTLTILSQFGPSFKTSQKLCFNTIQ